MKKKIAVGIVIGILGVLAGTGCLYADEGAEVIQVHPIDVYPGAAQVYSTDHTLLLSKDAIEKVENFYQLHKQGGDRLEPFNENDEQGYRLIFHRTIGGKAQSVLEVQITERAKNTNLHPALGELKVQSMMGKHSEAEYKTLENKYINLTRAYFREARDDQGKMVPEGELIYRKARKQAHPAPEKANSGEQAAGKAQAQELKEQMQALKAKGDYAGMMKMAQESKASPTQTKAGAAAVEAMNQDTWELWVKCLQDLDAAAYRTRLQYNYNAIPQKN